MVQTDDSDEGYVPTGADGTDDEDRDFEQDDDDDDDDDYQDTDADDTTGEDELGNLGDIVLSPCTVPFSRAVSTECATCYSAQTSNLGTTESQMLRQWLRCRNSSPIGRVGDWSGSYNNHAEDSDRSKRNQRTRTMKMTFTIHPIGVLCGASSAPETIGTRRLLSPNLPV